MLIMLSLVIHWKMWNYFFQHQAAHGSKPQNVNQALKNNILIRHIHVTVFVPNICLFCLGGSLLPRVNGILFGTGNMIMIRHPRHMRQYLIWWSGTLNVWFTKKIPNQTASPANLDDWLLSHRRNWQNRQKTLYSGSTILCHSSWLIQQPTHWESRWRNVLSKNH